MSLGTSRGGVGNVIRSRRRSRERSRRGKERSKKRREETEVLVGVSECRARKGYGLGCNGVAEKVRNKNGQLRHRREGIRHRGETSEKETEKAVHR